MFNPQMIETARGNFEIFKRGFGAPLAFTHLYSEFNELGNIMSQHLAEYYTVYKKTKWSNVDRKNRLFHFRAEGL
ncbi:Proline iminopeptidase [Lacicoccus alkaliphilus]|uniref:Proline iminopeptidase n=1 Tax=Lacicoccus alkaliphilus DSM 16010 TaxID=1123231 RepID=A0A1M7BV25_9BACL|nr:proline iminopeptidase [Salinicoccus alkaliphilus DSM 16010]